MAAACVAVDADDLVIGATRSARAALGIAPVARCSRCPRPICSAATPRMTISADGQRAVLQRALLRAGGNVSAAAKALGVSRATLHRKLKRFEINPH